MLNAQDYAFRNLKHSKFYTSTANMGAEGYNAKITITYNSNNDILLVEEEWRNYKWSQVISGSVYPDHIPNYTETFFPWQRTSISG